MKRILIISTGGTICSRLVSRHRVLAPDISESTLMTNLYADEKYASLSGGIFENSGYSDKILSENMTVDKLSNLISHIRSFDLDLYSGVIILHGTDTLAYTASLLSIFFSDTPIPIALVSGDAPPDMACSNANINFASAVDLILSQAPPNVYVPYKNENEAVKIHLASRLMQSPSFTSNFYSIGGDFDFEVASRARKPLSVKPDVIESSVLLIQPYVGLDYTRISLDGVSAVAHTSYHSGTFCTDGGACSFIEFTKKCHQMDIPVFVAPCKLGENQYDSVYVALEKCSFTPLYMTAQALYAKLVIASSLKLKSDEREIFVKEKFNSELI